MRSIILPTDAVRALLDNGECQHKVPVRVPKWLQQMDPQMEDAWPDLMYGVSPGLKVPCKQFADGTPDEIVERLRNPWDFHLVNGSTEGLEPIRMAVRETWCEYGGKPIYRADYAGEFTPLSDGIGGPWRSGAIMPRAFSRLTVELTGVWPKRDESGATPSWWRWLLTLKRVEAR
jgi:hypothetical protein